VFNQNHGSCNAHPNFIEVLNKVHQEELKPRASQHFERTITIRQKQLFCLLL